MSAELNEHQLDPAIALCASEDGTARSPHRQFALKHEDTFVVADAHGDISGAGDGLFRDDTRILSRLRLTVGGRIPSLLGSSLSQDNILFTANLTNAASARIEGSDTPHSVVHIERVRFLWQERMYERIALTNYSARELVVPLTLEFDADFRDMFEVRGTPRIRRGRFHAVALDAASATFRYDGLDDVARSSVISFSADPEALDIGSAAFRLRVGRRGRETLFFEVGAERAQPSRERFRAAAARARFAMRSKRRHGAALHSSGRVFNDWLARARADLALLTTDLPTGPYPYAGIPWFSTAFGRDGIISALEMLWVNPGLARGVLSFLARHQSTETSAFGDSEPGKIMHETRKGEMAVLRELPFGLYYGGVDTTPLYVYLATSYADRTGDAAFLDALWPSLVAAAGWMEETGKRNGSGFITYSRAARSGLNNQGWKDSAESVFHRDGSTPRGPIALVEVQGYAYGAYKGLASLARRRGDEDRADHWAKLAERLRTAVEDAFWMEEPGFYAMALDGDGRPCAVRASNAGHLLFVGLPAPERAARVAAQMMSGLFFSGWGIRTLADDEVPFNPMSYHNGAVWPHDTAISAAGFGRYGDRQSAVKLMSGIFEAAVNFDMRLPELFCGFSRAAGEAPVAYPVACLPQAWSAGSVFMLMQACLGLRIDGWRKEITVERPALPIGIDRLAVRRLPVGDASVDLFFERVGRRVVAYLDEAHEGQVPLLVRS